jgi:putative membrane protein
MIGIIVQWIITTVAILIVAYIMPGVRVAGIGGAFVAAAILGILNAIVRPILVILTFPITILTLGLFLFIINAFVFWFVGSIYSGLRVDSFGTALIASIIVSIVSFFLNFLFW